MSCLRRTKHDYLSNEPGLQVEPLENRLMLSTVEIIASGATGEEQLDVFIDQTYVSSFQNIGREFETYVFETDETLTADRFAIGFGNDLYNPATGFDRNLYVDRIIIDGVTYQTEHPSTSSTGIWSDGLTGPGNFQTEEFNINAIFSYSNAGSNARTLIEVDAQGKTGEEFASVLVNGQLDSFVTFDSPNQRKTFKLDTDADIDLSGVSVNFVNDFYDPANNFDRNLYVYSIKVTDLITGETQFASTTDDNVYSEGVYLESDGFQAGFGRGPQLFTNGFVEVRDPVVDSGLVLDASFGENGEVASSVDTLVTNANGRIATSRFGQVTVHYTDGSLDTRFGNNGTVDLADLIGERIGNTSDSRIRITDLDLFEDGSLLAVGTFQREQFSTDQRLQPIIAKLTTSGQLDSSFVANGVLNGTFLNLPTQVFAGPIHASVARNGAVVIAGQAVDDVADIESNRNPNIVVTRLNLFGAIDRSFGDNGNVFFDKSNFAGGHEVLEVKHIDFGRTVIGTASVSFGSNLIRLKFDGSLDSSFGTNGIYKTNPTGEFSAGVSAVGFEIDSQGRYVLGDRSYQFTRVTADGMLDTSFGVNGESTFELDPGIQLLSRTVTSLRVDDFVLDKQDRVLILSSASLVIPGRAGFPTAIESKGSVVVRLDASGLVDSGFNETGYELIATGQGGQSVSEAALTAKGNLLIAGFRYASTDSLGSDPTIAKLKFV